MIKFPATNTTHVGQMIRYYGKRAKFWKVVRIVNGVAHARAAGFGTDPRVACC